MWGKPLTSWEIPKTTKNVMLNLTRSSSKKNRWGSKYNASSGETNLRFMWEPNYDAQSWSGISSLLRGRGDERDEPHMPRFRETRQRFTVLPSSHPPRAAFKPKRATCKNEAGLYMNLATSFQWQAKNQGLNMEQPMTPIDLGCLYLELPQECWRDVQQALPVVNAGKEISVHQGDDGHELH